MYKRATRAVRGSYSYDSDDVDHEARGSPFLEIAIPESVMAVERFEVFSPGVQAASRACRQPPFFGALMGVSVDLIHSGCTRSVAQQGI